MTATRISKLLRQIAILLIICCCSLSTQAKYGGGSGTPEDPYQIRDANHMQAIGADSNDWDKHFKLMVDIDLSYYDGKEGRPQFNMIGEYIGYNDPDNKSFGGVFDGNGNTISNFTCDSNERDYVGLFEYIDDPNTEVKNLGLINVEVIGEKSVGSLVGKNKGKITSCYTEGGSVEGFISVGGLVGNNWGNINNCYSTNSVLGGFTNIGGLAGDNGGTITDCYASGNVTGTFFVGGLLGINGNTISYCYSTGSVICDDESGGAGGLAGMNYGIIKNCYAAGSLTANRGVCGLVVNNICSGGECGTITNSYWDIETSGELNMCCSQEEGAIGCDNSYGLPTSELHQQSTFTNWDFIDVWNIGENQTYPYLRTYLAGDINKDGIVNFKDFAYVALQWLEECNFGNRPPRVLITYPEDGARLMVGGVPPQTMIWAEANDYDGTVVRVEFFVDDVKLGEDTDGSDGWSYLWQNYSLGFHVLTAAAWDNEGLSAMSTPVNVEVWMPDPPPP